MSEPYKIRRHYDEDTETWYFSVVDIIQMLIQQPDYQAARTYWKVLKNLLTREGSESVTKCNRLKLEAKTGRRVITGENFLPPGAARSQLELKKKGRK